MLEPVGGFYVGEPVGIFYAGKTDVLQLPQTGIKKNTKRFDSKDLQSTEFT